jgi:hypothetical protein
MKFVDKTFGKAKNYQEIREAFEGRVDVNVVNLLIDTTYEDDIWDELNLSNKLHKISF